MNCLEYLRRNSDKPLAGGDMDGGQYDHANQYLADHSDINSINTISKDEWEAITLYLVFAFKKRSSST